MQTVPRRRTRIFLFALLAGLALTGPALLLAVRPWLPFFRATTGLRTRRSVEDFVLTGTRKEAVRFSDYSDRYRFVFFGFTRCQTVCPRTLRVLRQLVETSRIHVSVFFISADPEYDTPERLRQFFSHEPDGFVALTGSRSEIGRVATSIGAQLATLPGPVLEHSSAIWVIDPRGEMVLYYAKAPADAQTLLADLDVLEETNL